MRFIGCLPDPITTRQFCISLQTRSIKPHGNVSGRTVSPQLSDLTKMLSTKKAQKAIQWTKIVVLGDGAVGKSGKQSNLECAALLSSKRFLQFIIPTSLTVLFILFRYSFDCSLPH